MTHHLIAIVLGGLLCVSSRAAETKPIPSVPTDQPVVALTFDDGPHATQTARMLELFAASAPPATD